MPGLVVPATAHAADDPRIHVEVTKLVKTDNDGNAELDTQLSQWNIAKLEARFDASALPTVAAGTTFSLSLPAPLNFRQHPRTDEMKVTDDGGTERVVGECVTEASTMTCTFNQEAEDLSRSGFKNFTGTMKMLLTAVEAYDSQTVQFNLNGRIVDIDLPGDGGIAPEAYRAEQLTKWTRDVVTLGQETNIWSVYFGTDYMRDNVKPSGTIKTDGSVSTLVLHDILATGQVFDWSRENKVKLAINKSADNSNHYEELWIMDGSVKHPDWDVEIIRTDDDKVSAKITGPFPESTNMLLNLPVRFTEPAKAGVKYTNQVSVDGLESSTSISAYYVDSVEITVNMEPGYGTFKVGKLIEGSGASMLDKDVKFPLTVDFTLPGHYSTYNPVWQPPAGFTMDADGVNGHGTIWISPGKTTYFDPNVTLPMGTKVRLSEDPSGAQPAAPSTITWEAPVFDTAEFEIGDRKVTSVNITNKANYVPAPAAVSVGDYVWEDVNKDGLQDATDKPIEGVTLTISRADGGTVNNADGTPRGELTTKTDASGKYLFDNLEVLPAGTHYVVSVSPDTVPAGLVPTKDAAGDSDKDSSAQAGKAESTDLVNDGDSDLTLDFGYIRPQAVSVGDYVWEDVNKDGLQDATDKPIEGVELTISRSDGAKVTNADGAERPEADLMTKTDASGKYLFENLEVLPAGTHYVVSVTGGVPGDLVATKDAAGDRDKDSSAEAGKAESTDLVNDGDSDLTLDFGYIRPQAVSVGDYVWWDVNKDGLQDATDKPIEGVELTISRSDGAKVTNPDGTARTELTTKTDASGKYLFDNLEALPAGVHYVVSVTQPDGYLPTKDAAGDRDKDSSAEAGKAESTDLVNNGDSDLTLDFGYVKPAVSVGDYVWWDVNKDGLQDATDKPIEGVSLTISRSDTQRVNNASGDPLDNLVATTDADGKYLFSDLEVLPAGVHYVVTVTPPNGYQATQDGAGDRAVDSSAQAGSAESTDLVNNGDSDLTLDFGFIKPAVSVGDYVWEDVNKDGLQDATDKPIEGVTLTISRSDGGTVNNADGTPRGELTTKTAADGSYSFTELEALPAGTHYVVTVTQPDGFVPTKDGAGDRDKDSSAEAGKAESTDLVNDGDSDMTLDFGFVRPVVSVGDYVWEDVNKDGLQDDTDKPIEGVTLTISRSDGGTVNNADGSARGELTTTTDASGKYVFDGLQVLPAGTHYVVTVSAPAGYEPTTDAAGGREVDSSAQAGMAESTDLVNDGDSDMTLDFGYVKLVQPPATTPPATSPATPTPSVKPKPGKPLAKTGASILVPLLLAGAAIGGGSLLVARRRQDG